MSVLWAACAVATATALATAFVRSRRAKTTDAGATAARDRLIAAPVASTPLLIPYFMHYDLLLLAVPAVLLASDLMRTGELPGTNRWTVRAWVALYAWLYLNPGLAGMMRMSLTLPLLASVAGSLILRCGRPSKVAAPAAPRKLTPPERRPLAA